MMSTGTQNRPQRWSMLLAPSGLHHFVIFAAQKQKKKSRPKAGGPNLISVVRPAKSRDKSRRVVEPSSQTAEPQCRDFIAEARGPAIQVVRICGR